MTAGTVAPEQPAPATGRRRHPWRRRLLVALLVLVLLLVALFGAAGWYFAGQIDDDALAVHRPTTASELDPGRDLWTDPTDAFGVAYSTVDIPCAGGSCPAWLVPGTATTWMVAVHGKGSTRTEPLRAMGPAVAAGLTALDISYRNDPGVPGDPSGNYGYGATEWVDLEQAVEYATAHGAQHVVLFGASMGGAIVASFLEHSNRADVVTGVVLDAPALDLRAVIAHGAAQRSLPVLGTPIPDVLTGTAEWIAGWQQDVDYDAVDYLPADWLRVPALVFHGTEDATVPVGTSDELAAAQPDLVQEVRVAGADHLESYNVDPDLFTTTETAFLGCVTGAPGARCTG